MDSISNPGPGWFVMYTRPRHERKIAEHLSQIEISHFLPLVKMLRTWSDRKKYIYTPLFPSYVFVKLNDSESYFRTLAIDGVLYYVRSGKQITKVSEAIIHNIELAVSHFTSNLEVSFQSILPGTSLMINGGPFIGFCCEVVQHKGMQKMIVRIELLKRSILLDMPVEYLMPPSVPQAV